VVPNCNSKQSLIETSDLRITDVDLNQDVGKPRLAYGPVRVRELANLYPSVTQRNGKNYLQLVN
jgi:hypothetical protein